MNRKIFLSESEKNIILNMHKNAVKKEFLIESGDPPSPTPTPTPTPTSTLNPETPEQFEKYRSEWKAKTSDEKSNYLNNTLLPLVEKKLTDKVSAKIDALTKDVQLSLGAYTTKSVSDEGKSYVSGIHFYLYGNGNSFEYDFGNHSQVSTTQEGNPRYISSFGEGPELSNEILLGSSSIDTVEIANSIMNELSGIDKIVYAGFAFFTLVDGQKMSIKNSIESTNIPVGIKPYSTEDNPGRGYLYFDNTSKDCNSNLGTKKLIKLTDKFNATELFSVNEPVDDKKKFVCLSGIGKDNYKFGNSNLTMTSPNFNGFITKIKEDAPKM